MRIDFLGRPDVDTTIVYQRYYLQALETVASVRYRGAPPAVRLVPGAARKTHLLRTLTERGLRRGVPDSGLVGRYVSGGVKFAIDARDSHPIRDDDVLAWSDVYFKANLWPSVEYPEIVRPIVNGNGLLATREIARLRALRDRERDLDFAFVSNVWGGREHNVRLFEELARHEGPKALLAVLPVGADDDEEVISRLDAAGVPWTRTPLATTQLWDLLSRARVVPFRSGKHLCIPWRMLDLLALGAAILFDAPPLPQWPVPLEEDVHYASLGLDRDADDYSGVLPGLVSLLREDARRTELRSAAAQYFDEHAAPECIGAYVADVLRSSAA